MHECFPMLHYAACNLPNGYCMHKHCFRKLKFKGRVQSIVGKTNVITVHAYLGACAFAVCQEDEILHMMSLAKKYDIRNIRIATTSLQDRYSTSG